MRLFFDKSKRETTNSPTTVDSGRACAVFQHFPIGTAAHYYPEFKRNIALETVIIGYMLNRIPVFSAQEIACEGKDANARLLIRHERQPAPLSSFSVIIPAESRGVGRLDYIRREELDRSGGLAVGNHITLMGQAVQGKLPVVETTVGKITKFSDSPYSDLPVSVLDIDVASLLLTDQRTQRRIPVRLPVRIEVEKQASLACTMADFCERSVRLRSESGWPAAIIPGQRLSVVFRLPGRDRDTVLRGEVYRLDYIDLVLMLDGIQRDGLFRRIEIIDVLEMKAKLLQLPEALA